MDVRFAIDIGASSGRHIVGRTEGGELKTEEIYRFPNGVTKRDGHLIWDLEALPDHGKACIRISSYLAEELGQPCVMNIWTGDGFKDVPADRMGPRLRYKESIDEILSECYDFDKVKPCIESKVFGIGVEAYTAGSGEFALSYAAMNRDKCIPLMDNGHYHPTEVVSDKIPALPAFFPEIALHVTRPIRWDSDHVVRFDDETREIAKEIVRCGRPADGEWYPEIERYAREVLAQR